MSEPLTDQEREELASALRDPVKRLCSLYWIRDAHGKAIRFRPKSEQMKIILAIYRDGVRKIIIPKARQLGMSTVIALIILDMTLFGAGNQIAIIDQTQADATKKLRGKVVFAFERLPAKIRDQYQIEKSNDHTFSLRLKGSAEDDEDAKSEVQAGMNARGDTFQLIHVSEWGPIAHKDPKRSEEIMTGALPAAKAGIVVIETTWKGGKVGHLWDLTTGALEVPEHFRTAEDYRVFFFPWWGDPDYSLAGDNRQITREAREYLDETEAEIRAKGTDGKTPRPGFKFSPEQRLWYFKVAWKKGLYRFQEYPSMLSECFRAPVEGAIYAELLDALRAAGRIAAIEPAADVQVHTCWDLGGPMNIVTWYFQLVGGNGLHDAEIRFIDCDCHLDLTPGERVEHMRRKASEGGFTYGFHYLPHDAEASKEGGRTVEAELAAVGLDNIRVVPRTDDVWIGINRVRGMMPRMSFRTPLCDVGLNSLEAYHSGIWIEKGRQMDLPVHDKASHAADAMRTLAEADLAEMLGGAGTGSSVFSTAGLAALKKKTES